MYVRMQIYVHLSPHTHIYIYAPPPPAPGLPTLFGQFWVEMTEVAHSPGCNASRPIRGECLVDAKVRRGLGLVPCPPKSPKAIHTLGVVVCRSNLLIIKEPWSLSGVPHKHMLPPSLKDQRSTVSSLHCFKNAIERVLTVGALMEPPRTSPQKLFCRCMDPCKGVSVSLIWICQNSGLHPLLEQKYWAHSPEL